MATLLKIGGALCVAFAVLACISLVLPFINEIYHPLYGTDSRVLGYSPPSLQHILGTDFMGRDLFSQLCAGALHAFIHGIEQSALALPVLLFAAFVLSRLRKETPHFEDTLLIRYIRFVAFPLGVTALLFFFVMMFLPIAMSLRVWILLVAVGFSYLGWLAVGRDIEVQFRKKKIPVKLFLSFVALVVSYSTLLDGVLGFFGLESPRAVSWGMMVQWCFTSGYTFKALHWLLPPILCIYLFSRGMLALSYGLSGSAS